MSSPVVSGPFESALILVTVGDEDKRTFTIHRDIICQASSFFNNCLRSGLSESSCNVVSLPEDKPAVFEVAVSLAYGRALDDASFPEMTWGEEVKLLTATYVLADKLGMESTGNNIMDRIKDISADGFVAQQGLDPIYWIFSEEEFILPQSKLRTFLVECLAGRTSVNDWSWGKADADFYTLGGAHVSEIVRLMAAKKYSWEQPWRRINCEYHNHKDTIPCKENAKSKKRKAT